MKTAPLLSIGMIFKNEARCLERCLKSLEPLREAIPCELIMADTGSGDGSRAIAERYADEVFDFEWIDDFSAARNAVMERCHGKWYLSIDCDEWLDKDISEMMAFLQNDEQADFGLVTIRNYHSADLSDGEAYSDVILLRLLRISTGIRYQGAIHETWPYYEQSAKTLCTVFHHDGYLFTDPKIKKQKLQRNIRLLENELTKNPEDLRTLNQWLESGKNEGNFVGMIRRAVEKVKNKRGQWRIYGGTILRHAVAAAYERKLPELNEWIAFAEKEFPESAFIRVDLQYTAFLAAFDAGKWDEAIRRAEAYRQGLRMIRADRPSAQIAHDLKVSNLQSGDPTRERALKILLANAYLQGKQEEKARKTLWELDSENLQPEQMRNAVIVFCNLRAQSEVDIAPTLIRFYNRLEQGAPEKKMRNSCIEVFLGMAAQSFTKSYREEEQKYEGYCRPGYTVFRALSGQCEAGRAAAIMMTDSPSEMRAWLLKVEDWQALPVEALEHALRSGVDFPLEEKPLPIEVLDGLAARLAGGENFAKQTVFSLSENEEYPDLQSLFWAQSLAMAALRGFDWSLGKNEAPVSKFACPEKKPGVDKKPECTPEEGLALLRRFAQIESAVLPILYTPQALAEENAALLPPMHRWGLYCARALEALDGGNPQEYLAILRRGLAACPGEKDMVQFLLDRFVEDARPKASPELLALAEKVRTILAAYGPNDPAVAALKESPAYKQVAWIIEQEPLGQKVQ